MTVGICYFCKKEFDLTIQLENGSYLHTEVIEHYLKAHRKEFDRWVAKHETGVPEIKEVVKV